MKFGFSCLEISQTAFAFKANIHDVIEALSIVANVTSHKSNIISKDVSIKREPCLMVLQMIDYDWIIVFYGPSEMSKGSGSSIDLAKKKQAFSELIGNSVVLISTTSTGDFSCFWHYKKGRLIDKLETVYEKARGYEDRELTSELLNYLLENEPDFVVDTYFHHVDFEQNIDRIVSIDQSNYAHNSFAITERFMQKNKIYLPSMFDINYSISDSDKLHVYGIPAVQIERLDIVSLNG